MFFEGGRGAEISGNFSLSAGETLQIAVGGVGADEAGGGGSFVVGPPGKTLLVIAGGGGGTGALFRGVPGQGGLSGPNGGDGVGGGIGAAEALGAPEVTAVAARLVVAVAAAPLTPARTRSWSPVSGPAMARS